MSAHNIEALIAQAFVKPIEAAVQKSVARSALRALLDTGMSITEVVDWIDEVIREITPDSEPIEEADSAGLDSNATPANVDDANNTPSIANFADISAAKIEDLEIKVRPLQDEVREMAKNGAAAMSNPKWMVNDTNEGETNKMHSAKKTRTDSFGGHKVDWENTSSEDSRPPLFFGGSSSNPPFYFGGN